MPLHQHSKSRHPTLQRLKVFAPCALAAFLFPLSALAYDFHGCRDCHNETLAGDNSRIYLHAPFKEGQCRECHAPAGLGDYAVAQADRQKISWLAESAIIAANHVFILPADKVGSALVVELPGTAGGFSLHEIAIPSWDTLAELEDYGKPPTISEAKVLRVERGLLLSATIGWQTDTLADASVRYGNQDLTQLSEPGARLARQHQVVLSNLMPNKQYHFTAISHDLFGRSQVSEPLTFSTSDPSAPEEVDIPEPLAGDGNAAGIVSRFQRFGANYLVELRLEPPSSIYVGSRGLARCLPDDMFHDGLNCGLVRSTVACLNCHSAHLDLLKVSSTEAKITLPPEYPTLADGQITCTSCHSPHGSDYRYYTRKPSEQELCASCHLSAI